MGCFIDYLVNLYPNDPTAFWTMCLVGVTILLVFIAGIQLRKISKTGSADFAHRLKKDFFVPETRQLIMFIDQEWIKFTNDSLAGFEVIDDFVPEGIKGEIKKQYYSGYEMDDFVLGHFEDLGLFKKGGVIDIGMVYECFDWYIETVWENEEIQKYIESQRKKRGTDIYDKFEYIYRKCKSYGEKKMRKSAPE